MRSLNDWKGKCERCGKETNCHTMSWFNTDLICMDCSKMEKEHPDYLKAREAELKACEAGDYNFPGIGWKG